MAAAEIALIVPVLNEEDSAARFPDSVLSQTRGPDSTIVVDAGSDDTTCAIVEQYASGDAHIKAVPGHIKAHERHAMSNMYLTAAGFALEGGLVSSSRHLANKAVKAKPSVLLRPSGFHKLAYCYYGRTRAYTALRSIARGNGSS